MSMCLNWFFNCMGDLWYPIVVCSSGNESFGAGSDVRWFDLEMNAMELHTFLIFIFLKFLEDMSPFFGATDTPILDFWWHLLWVSETEWILTYSSLAEVYVLCYTFPEIHLWCDTCWPLGSQHGSQAVSSTYLQAIGVTYFLDTGRIQIKSPTCVNKIPS